MHKSAEILDVVAILFGKLKELGLVFDGGAAIHLFSEGSRDATIWVMSPELSRPIVNKLPYEEVIADNPIILDVWKAKDTGQHITNRHYSFEEKREYFEYVFKHNANVVSEQVKNFIRSANSYTANFIAEKNSLLGASSWTGQVFSENDIEVLKRVARVFEQAYIRFLDLQRAEAQEKEATIEAALEKIRSRSLGMHQSHELNDVVAILFEKLKELELPFDGGAGLFLFSEGSRDTSFWVTNGYIPPVCNYLPYDESNFSDNAIMQDVWKAKDTGDPIVSKHYSSEEKNKLFSYTSKHNDETKIPESERKRVLEANSYTATFIPERNSLLSVDSWTKQIMSASDIEVLKRFARVFEQAYVRFLDLQKAEVHAKEAVCQASLDRVRAEIASMRTVEDLDRITPLIWRELNTMGIPFIRCGVFIMDEPNRVVHTFLSTPDGRAIAVFQLPFDTPGRLGAIVPHWQDEKIFLDYWDDVAKQEVADMLVNRGIFSSSQQYLDTLPKEGFHLHCLPFAQGMLYVANLTQLKDEELTLLQSLADSFATAYARYDDFNKLESAKQQVDRTLVDLKQAQQQLVQSEKMASLGELTAGIAHEIQNPLNFVNNFSEVSNELIDEMKTELQAGNLKEAAELAESIKQNLEKITHHGKRADGIVKGMLQHSRAGSGQKEPTDLNFLCDEYLRLAYHGYRAKEKSFNAKFESSFDPTLPKVNVVGQDIGRVILNLINNAFYAVTEMKRQKVDGYEPIVSVITKNLSGKVEIRVKDNGIGISEKVKEKIFQPFFTTKPTGQGTGLGLSLSYDIIKAHGGALDVSSKQGGGSEFIIQLPV
jgi:signal transduction histidine kinase